MINNILPEELENEIIKDMEKNDFFFIFEYYAKKKNIKIDLSKPIVEQFGFFLKSQSNRILFEEFITKNEQLDDNSKEQYFGIINKINYFYNNGNSSIKLSTVNNINYTKTDEEILADETQELIFKILVKKGNNKNIISYNKSVLKENGEKEELSVFMNFFRIKIGGITSIYSNDLVDVNCYNLLEVLNVFSEIKFKHLDIDKSFFEKISVLDINNLYNFHDIKFIKFKYSFIEKSKVIIRDGLLTENGDILNIEGEFFISNLYGEEDILGKKFLKAGDENGVYTMFDIHSKPIIVNGQYLCNIKKHHLQTKGSTLYNINHGKIIISELELTKQLEKYDSFDISNVEVEEIYD